MKVAELYRMRELKPSTYRGTEFLAGVEIEAEGVPAVMREHTFKYWVSHRDGSLRNDGWEFVMRTPVGADLNKALVEYDKLASQHKLQYNARTSVHVHISVQHLTKEQLQHVFALYLALESVLMRKVPEYRRNSLFCIPLNHTSDFQMYLQKFMNGREPPVPGKYSALGTFRLHNLGTVEFRMLHGTGDIGVIENWTMACARIVEQAHNCTREQMLQLLTLDAEELARMVIGPDVLNNLPDYPGGVAVSSTGAKIAAFACLVQAPVTGELQLDVATPVPEYRDHVYEYFYHLPKYAINCLQAAPEGAAVFGWERTATGAVFNGEVRIGDTFIACAAVITFPKEPELEVVEI